ncbi:MAG TPA: glycosyl hydrolase family 18 protein [Holophaga sp.]|nr:glycosyl hydrolase family 18 protein [Holophaga sp.]
MRIALLVFLMLTSGACAWTKELGGWVTYWNQEAGLRSTQSGQETLSNVFLFALEWNAAGNPVPCRAKKDWKQVVKELHQRKLKVWLTVVNDHPKTDGKMALKDPDLTHDILTDSSRQKQHITQLLNHCKEMGVDGLDVDYENLNYSDRDAFSAFIQNLAKQVHKQGLQLSVTVQPKQRELRSSGAGAMDWSALGQTVDRLQIMLYNLHNAKTSPGPVCTLSWCESVLAFAESQCPKTKVIPALKVSGYEWGSQAREITFAELTEARKSGSLGRDEDGQAPNLIYTKDNKQLVAYYEDAVSLNAKICALQAKGFSHIVLWSLGTEDPALWTQSKHAH